MCEREEVEMGALFKGGIGNARKRRAQGKKIKSLEGEKRSERCARLTNLGQLRKNPGVLVRALIMRKRGREEKKQ